MSKIIIFCNKCEKKMRVPIDKHIRLNCVNCREEIEVKNGVIFTPIMVVSDEKIKRKESIKKQQDTFKGKINDIVERITEKAKDFFQGDTEKIFKGRQQFFIKESAKTGAIISLGVLIFLVVIIGGAILGNYVGSFIESIFKLAIIIVAIKLFITFSNRKIIIAEIFDSHLSIAKNISVGGKIMNLTFMYKLFSDKFERVDIPFKNIESLTLDTGFFSNGLIMINGIDNTGAKFRFPSALTSLEEKDLKKIQIILNSKGVKM